MILDSAVLIKSRFRQKSCVECHELFRPVGTNAKYCDGCRRTVQRRTSAASYRRLHHSHIDQMVSLPKGPGSRAKLNDPLHDLELQTLGWLELGKDRAAIAEIMGCGCETVTTRLGRIMIKLGVATATAAVARAIRRRMI